MSTSERAPHDSPEQVDDEGLDFDPGESMTRLFHVALDLLVYVGLDGSILRANPSFLATFGWSESELRAMRVLDLFHPNDRGTISDVGSSMVRDNCAVAVEARMRTIRGDYRWVSWYGCFDSVSGRVFASGRDITAHKELLAELNGAKESAEEAMRMAAVAEQTRSSFLSNMSHELRTPLNGILGYAQLLQVDSELSARQREGVETILRSGEHLLVLINDMLDLAKVEAGVLPIAPAELLLDDFLANLAGRFELRAQSKRIGFSYQALTDLPRVIRCDEKRLRQVLTHLLALAIRRTEHGGVVLRVGFSDGILRLHIEEAERSYTQPPDAGFFAPLTGRSERAIPLVGTMLELPARLLQSIGGSLVVERVSDTAQSYWIDLVPELMSTWSPAAPASRIIEGYEGARRTLLVVDDKAENRNLLIHLLEPLGFELVLAKDGHEALELLPSVKPDLVLMDLVMPVLDGFEATRRLRARTAEGRTPVIAMSASSFDPDHSLSREAGCDGFLAKPFDREALLAMLAEHLVLTWRYRQPMAESSPMLQIPELGEVAAEPAPADGGGVDTSLSAAQLQTIYDAASIGDIRAILTIIEEARKIASEQSGADAMNLIEEIHRLAKRFQARKIKERVEPLLDNG
ncbi:response regulator [Haliangium ochraceum]|uniref:histidine kinase n=1 Tax=Haliangium ochraceum (strain DSM 14365 / JCM 11303 / SMP-2) TaxID=502025 RepID=D0LGZ7_HALO1|nr:response regulator [Haliangium ochraceum]ACY14719.1 PAS/PAC sensor hybrid histidine kinase [Haliangium ochraceum DSM 14365]